MPDPLPPDPARPDPVLLARLHGLVLGLAALGVVTLAEFGIAPALATMLAAWRAGALP